MRIGVTIHCTDQTISPVEAAAAAENRGFDSFYIPEHTHIPTSRITPAPTGDEVLGEEYKRSYDPFVALAACSQATSGIILGTGVSLVAQHHPITLAKTVASLDVLSEGRFVLGAGFGWNAEEMAHHGVDPKNRRAVFRETVLAMYQLWQEEEAEFKGEFVGFEASWSWPKPFQRDSKTSRPPVLLGGAGGAVLFSHIAEYADGWMPIGGAGMKEKLPQLKEEMNKQGRNMSEMEIVPFGVMGTAEKLDYYRSIGATEAVLRLPGAGRDEVLKSLDGYVGLLG